MREPQLFWSPNLTLNARNVATQSSLTNPFVVVPVFGAFFVDTLRVLNLNGRDARAMQDLCARPTTGLQYLLSRLWDGPVCAAGRPSNLMNRANFRRLLPEFLFWSRPPSSQRRFMQRHDVFSWWVDDAFDQGRKLAQRVGFLLFIVMPVIGSPHAGNGVAENALGNLR